MKGWLAFGVLALVVLGGCVQQVDMKAAARSLPEVGEILAEYPSAYIDALFLSRDASEIAIGSIRSDCDANMAIVPYWYVTVSVGNSVTQLYVDETGTRVLCIIKPRVVPNAPKDECINKAECNDNDVSTLDQCIGIPKKCSNAKIGTCRSADGYCPAGCVYSMDADCPKIDECGDELDCSDANRLTKDSCSNTVPKACIHSLKTCAELKETLCVGGEECRGGVLPTSGSGVCCDVPCSKKASCIGVKCKADQKCVNGNCVAKSCAERSLPLCSTSQVCTEQYFKDDFGIVCCTGECRMPCADDSGCGPDEMCEAGYCIVKSCSDAGGETCDALKEKCSGETIKTQDNDNCCLQCTPKKCLDMGGLVCKADEGEFCAKAVTVAYDSPSCCLGNCDVNACYGVNCGVNGRCIDGECVLKACEEMDGVPCPLPELCDGVTHRAINVPVCCVGTCNVFGVE